MPPPITRRGLLALAGSLAAAPPAGGCLRAAGLRCEYLPDPEGIDAAAPRLSWRCAAAAGHGQGAAQTAYRIRAASSAARLAAGLADVWDSGFVASSASHQIPFGGGALRSRQQVFWCVQLADQHGRLGPVSETARFSMGLLAAQDWQADWIGLETPAPPAVFHATWFWSDEGLPLAQTPPGKRFFRRVFTLPHAAAPGTLTAYVAGTNLAFVHIDGRNIGAAFGWVEATTFRLPGLTAGPHVLTVEAANPGPGAGPAVLAVMLDGFFDTDAGWTANSHSEPGWQAPDFAATAWRKVRAWGRTSTGPWGTTALHPPTPVPARYLRRAFTLAAAPRRAVVSYAGLGWSELYVNGSRIGTEMLSPPLTDYDRRVTYLTHDITPHLRAGENVLGLMLGAGRYVAPRRVLHDYGWPKLKLRLDTQLRDGTTMSVTSDAAWRITLGGPIRDAHEYDGEIIDARLDMPGWSAPGFDASAWQPAQTVAAPAGRLVALRQYTTSITEIFPPVSIRRLGTEKFIFDFGQNIAGLCRLRTTGTRGQHITLRHAERLYQDGTLNTENLRTALAQDEIYLAGTGPETHTPRFTSHGFRYVQADGLRAATQSTLTALAISDALPRTGYFTCSDPMLNRVHEAALWSVRNNCRGIRTDCPQRDERLGWLGDPAEEAQGEAYMFDNAAFYAKWLDDILDTQRPNGALADIAPPQIAMYRDDLAWPAVAAALPAMLHTHYGDKQAVARAYSALVKWLDRMRAHGTDKFGDWGDMGKTWLPTPLIADAYLVHCLNQLSTYATILGLPAEAATHAQHAQAARANFQHRHARAQDGLFGDAGATSCILALAFNLAEPAAIQALQQRLVALITEGGTPHPCFGLIGAQFVSRVLHQAGRGDLVHQMAVARTKPGFGYMLDQGATTLWELWDADTANPSMASMDHTMLTGDLIAWMYQHLAGIAPDPAYPGFTRIILAPQPIPTLTWARARYTAITGTITSAWHRTGGRTRYSFTVPPNVQASIRLPGLPARVVGAGAYEFDGVT